LNNNNRGNNNNSNNRRRGRGNNRQQGGGGQQTNRVDSRARGNAPQMLEKYRKLAHDAHLNGDRVQSEYYLQFADHYFRVIADTRIRQEEQRARRDDRWEGGEGQPADTGGEDDFSVESDFPSFDQPTYSTRREREERGERVERPERIERPEQAERGERPERAERQPREEPRAVSEAGEEAVTADGQAPAANPYEPPENPFVRPNRNNRGLRPRREDRQPRGEQAEQGEPLGLDPSSLPPSIARDEAPVAADEPAAEAKPRRRAPRRKVVEEGGDTEAAASVG
jgi:hypothetical protein